MKLVALIKKEFHRFFHDPRLIVTILLPGIVIFLLYTLLGNIIHTEESREMKVYLSGNSAVVEVLEQQIKESGDKVEWLPLENEEEARAAVKEGEATAILTFSENFDLFGEGARAGIVYDSGSENGSYFYGLVTSVLISVGMRFPIDVQTVNDSADMGREILTSLLPFLVVTFVFSACMSVTLESVAGEKERGTLSTILATSVKRSHIALGKIIPLSCISAIGAASSFLGVVLSLPKLMGLDAAMFTGYSFISYLLLFLLILSFVPLIVSAIATVSTLSRSVKEASAYTSVLMILVMIVSIVSLIVAQFGDWVVAVPVLNAVTAMGQILSGMLPVWQSLVSVGVNLVFTALLVWLIAKMLSSERVMFGK